MAKWYDLDTDTRINGKLTVNGDILIPSSNLLVGGNITGNAISGSTATITTISGSTGNIANINSTGTISGSIIKGNGATLTVSGTTANGGVVPISNGWAYTHENKVGSQGHIPTGGSATTFLRGDNTWVIPTDTNNYISGVSSTDGGNGTLTINRSGLSDLTLNLSHTHDSRYYTETELQTSGQSQVHWGNLTSVPGTFSPSVHYHAELAIIDKRDVKPADTPKGYIRSYFTSLEGLTGASGTDYQDLLVLNTYVDSSGGKVNALAFDKSTMLINHYQANQGDTTWGTPKVLAYTSDLTWANISSKPTLDNYASWKLKANTDTGIDITSGAIVDIKGSGATTISRSGSTITISSTDTNTDTNNYVTGISSTDGGNGTLTINRSGLTDLTLNLSHTHDSRYYTETEIDTLLGGKDYYGKWNLLVSGTTNGITSSGNVTVTGGGATSVSYANGTLTITSTDTNTWRAIDTSPVSANTANSIASSWAYTHSNTYGLGAHVPSGGSATTFLRGDGTWVTPTDTNTYVTGLSSTAGGNGTLTVTRNTGGNLTIDLSHTHSQYVVNNTTNQSVLTGFTMSGNAYVGTSSTTGALIVRGASGASAIQFAGDNSAQQAGVTVYMNASGNANFSGTISANSIKVSSTGLITNLNSEMLNGLKESRYVKTESLFEVSGKGVYTGLNVTAQAVPNMTVLVNAGTMYTDQGKRFTYDNTSVSLSASSSTYDRIDTVYVAGSSAGANEGNFTVALGTPSATPVAPTIPSDAISLANILVPKNIGSIQNTHITDARSWKPVRYYSSTNELQAPTISPLVYGSQYGVAQFAKPLQLNNSATSITISQGSTAYTWNHNLNLVKYAVQISCNNSEPHIYWSNKTVNAVTINLDDVCDSDVVVDIIIIAIQ